MVFALKAAWMVTPLENNEGQLEAPSSRAHRREPLGTISVKFGDYLKDRHQ